MGAGEQELRGPDLRAGVALHAVSADGPLLGHVDGEAVLLCRAGEEFSAIGATCTHYGGPLHDGVVTDGLVRCPWHHACFELRTGRAVSAPALSDLPRWETRVADGRVYVGAKIERDVYTPVGATATPATVVIVGAGAAGSAAAEMLRREGHTGRIVLIDPDRDAPYDRPNLSKDYLAGNAPAEWIPLRPQGFYEEHGIERSLASAVSIDVAARAVTLSDGNAISFDALLLATGAAPIRPPIPGAEQPHVHVLRSLADCDRLIAAVQSARHVAIAGASFIGLEAAASLRARGVDITVVAPERVPFERTLGAELGELLRGEHEKHGVQFRLGRMLREIRQHDVVLDDGSEIPADVVLLGVGVRPALDLARAAGLAGDNGVAVDAFLETRITGIYAAGDIALYPDAHTNAPIRVEHWVVAQRQGQTAARNILGRRQRFDDVPFFWTHQFDVPVRYVGHAGTWDATRVAGDVAARDCAVTFTRGDTVLAVATVNRDRAALDAELALEAAARRATD